MLLIEVTLSRIENISNESVEVNRANLLDGIYYFQLVGEKKTLTGKLVVQ